MDHKMDSTRHLQLALAVPRLYLPILLLPLLSYLFGSMPGVPSLALPRDMHEIEWLSSATTTTTVKH